MVEEPAGLASQWETRSVGTHLAICYMPENRSLLMAVDLPSFSFHMATLTRWGVFTTAVPMRKSEATNTAQNKNHCDHFHS